MASLILRSFQNNSENACGLLQTRVGTYPIDDPLWIEKRRKSGVSGS